MPDLQDLSKLLRYDILTSTTAAGTGHPTSSLSATELMTALMFGGFYQYDFDNPDYIFNDRLIFSKGHASPLYYALFHVAGQLSHDELMTLRKFDSVLEGHPTPRFKFTEAATGSLGQGLSVGVGMALGIKLTVKLVKSVKSANSTSSTDLTNSTIQREPKVFVLLGDSEMAEGQVWEAMEIASHYKLNNLIAIVDVNRLGQRGETMLGWDLQTFAARATSFGWEAIVVEDGHSIDEVVEAYKKAVKSNNAPVMIIAKTKKGKGISVLEDKDDWHGKALPKDKLEEALKEIGAVDLDLRGEVKKPEIGHRSLFTDHSADTVNRELLTVNYKPDALVATREAYGEALSKLGEDPRVVVLDAEVSNSTFADAFKKAHPDRFFEMYIAEQNMISVATGFAKLGYVPFSSTFAAFLTRAYDQVRMAQYSKANIKVAGSHAGVSIGYDGSSQMGLEDLSMFRSLLSSTVFYPSDAVSTQFLLQQALDNRGIVYMRTTREKTPILYKGDESFVAGGSQILKQSTNDVAVIFSAGITLHEALKAYEELKKDGVDVAVVDLYSVKPVDEKTVAQLSKKVKNVIVVEDHYPAGGIGEAVLSTSSNFKFQISNFIHLCVRKTPRSGSPAELLAYEEIDAAAIVKAVKDL